MQLFFWGIFPYVFGKMPSFPLVSPVEHISNIGETKGNDGILPKTEGKIPQKKSCKKFENLFSANYGIKLFQRTLGRFCATDRHVCGTVIVKTRPKRPFRGCLKRHLSQSGIHLCPKCRASMHKKISSSHIKVLQIISFFVRSCL